MHYKLIELADNYILLDFGNKIEEKTNKYILAMAECISHEAVLDVIPAYSSLLIEYDNKKADADEMMRYLKKIKTGNAVVQSRLIEIPVVYGGHAGPDLQRVADVNGLTAEEVVDIHCSREYRVYMLGFLPGFCYLGGMDERIACERLDNPRLKIPAGSVGIAGIQTGIYPEESPGGWNLIGKTDFVFYNILDEDPFPIKAGDRVKFVKAVEKDTVTV